MVGLLILKKHHFYKIQTLQSGKNTTHNGFSLIEMLVVLFISSAMLSIGWSAYLNIHQTINKIDKKAQHHKSLEFFKDIWRADLSATHPSFFTDYENERRTFNNYIWTYWIDKDFKPKLVLWIIKPNEQFTSLNEVSKKNLHIPQDYFVSIQRIQFDADKVKKIIEIMNARQWNVNNQNEFLDEELLSTFKQNSHNWLYVTTAKNAFFNKNSLSVVHNHFGNNIYQNTFQAVIETDNSISTVQERTIAWKGWGNSAYKTKKAPPDERGGE